MSKSRAAQRHPERHRKRRDVVISYAHSVDNVTAAFHTALVLTFLHDRDNDDRIGSIIGAASGPRVATARNQICEAFLNHPEGDSFEWMFMVDADMNFPPNRLDEMLAVAQQEQIPLLGGLAFSVSRAGAMSPTIRVLHEGKFLTIDDFPRDSLIQVHSTGAACLLIHRDVIKGIYDKWGDNAHVWFAETAYGGSEFGEDVTFCLRAQELGYPLHVHTGFEFLHMKPWGFGLTEYDRWRGRIAEVGEDQARKEGLTSQNLGGFAKEV